MENQITIREAVTENDIAIFWEQLYAYFKRDIFPDPADEDRAYFFGTAHRADIQRLHDRKEDRCHYLFFYRDGKDIGFAMPVIYATEDGKCFILEFCVYPAFRGGGTGRACAGALIAWAKENGAAYAELNFGGQERRCHFWERVGFVPNGADEWGEPLMILPPWVELPVTVEMLSDPEDWQLKKLENGFLSEIGEQVLSEERQKMLCQAVREKKIIFFMARRGYRAVGMCSVSRYWSTFSCADTAAFDDFYIEPVFRKKGIARKLTRAAQAWCEREGIASLTVCCAPCDEAMYQSLSFDARIGAVFAHLCDNGNAPDGCQP